jgi:Flp pilus assembly protein TadG
LTASSTAVGAIRRHVWKRREVFEMSFATKKTDRRPTLCARGHRQGAACVELALVSPLLLLLFLGIVDVGQFVNVGQSVSNASREGARIAARQTTTNVSKVEAAVSDYLTNLHPNLPPSSVQVTVVNAGSPITGGGITAVATGSRISVQVAVPFDAVRWIHGLPLLNGRTVTNTTVTRRE